MNRFNLAYGPRNRVTTDPTEEPSMTQQQFAEECDINNIMAKYQRTGALTHLATHGGTYGYAPAVDYQEAIELVEQADSMFCDLPSSLRKRFDNDPAQFLTFVQDPANLDEMRELGLAQPLLPVLEDERPSNGGPVGDAENQPTG